MPLFDMGADVEISGEEKKRREKGSWRGAGGVGGVGRPADDGAVGVECGGAAGTLDGGHC